MLASTKLKVSRLQREMNPLPKRYVHVMGSTLPYTTTSPTNTVKEHCKNKGSKARQTGLNLLATLRWAAMLNCKAPENVCGFMAPVQHSTVTRSHSFFLNPIHFTTLSICPTKQSRNHLLLELYPVGLPHTPVCLRCTECPSISFPQCKKSSVLYYQEIKKLTKSPPSVGMRTFISEDLALTISQSREFLLR